MIVYELIDSRQMYCFKLETFSYIKNGLKKKTRGKFDEHSREKIC